MIQHTLNDCELYKLLEKRNGNVAKSLSGTLISSEAEVAKTLEYIKTRFPNFTEHGMQHSLRIINYIYCIMSEELKQDISDVEIFCFIMAAFFHDMGMILTDIDDKDEQRRNHHLYAAEPIKLFFDKYIQVLVEKRRLEKCIIYVCEAHGKSIEEIYNDDDFRKIDRIEGQSLRYGLLTILLRIGDLMDLEEARICEFNMHINSEYYNDPLSMLHNRKYLDDITYNYNPNKINVAVLTDDRDKYKVWSQWLKYLDNEVMYANTHYLIRENSEFFKNYKLPEVKNSVEPSEDATFAVEEIRFQIDDTGELWNIIAKSVYTNEFDYVRELIQNAIDATLLKIYLDDGEKIKYKSPRSWNCNDKVIVAYSQKQGLLRIEDCGIGMNKSELSIYLFKTANSGYKYMKQREFIFPAIAKFGIGFVACLTKANKIQISTQTRNHNGIGAEIESESTMAFVEKSVQRDCQGTTIVLQIKENYSFFELRNYIFKYFNYPSVEIDLVNIDEMCTYIDKKDTFDKNISILQFVVHAGKKRKEKLDKTSFDYGFLQKMSNILLDDEDINNLINRIYGILDNVYIETEVTKRVRSVVNKMDEKEEIIRKVRKEVGKQKNIIDKKRKRYPEFLFQRHRSVIPEIVDYKQLILEFDDNFTIKEFYKDKQINVSSRGIIFIPTTFIDYNLGIEWRSVNAFMFNKGKVVKNIIKMSSDLSGILEYRNDIISLDYIADAQYEMGLLNEEKEDEAYYKDMNKNNHDESETDFNDLYDILFLKNNDFYKIFNVQTEQIENIMEDKEVMERHKLLEYVTVSEKYRGERFLFGESELYQDGILLNFNPQCIIPLGVGYVKANLTADSRLELNISRHELNNNKDVIRKWNKQVGYEIQRKVAENCINVLKKNNIDFEIHDLLSEREESFLKEKNFFAEKSFLTMRNVLNELLR